MVKLGELEFLFFFNLMFYVRDGDLDVYKWIFDMREYFQFIKLKDDFVDVIMNYLIGLVKLRVKFLFLQER